VRRRAQQADVHPARLRLKGEPQAGLAHRVAMAHVSVDLHTRLPLPILYGVWHSKEGSVWGACIAQWSCNSIAIGYALQVGGVNKRMVDSHDEALS